MNLKATIAVIFHLAYMVASIYYLIGAIHYFIGDVSFLLRLIAGIIVFVLMLIPGGQFVLLGALSYYLYVGEEWNLFAVIVFVFPGLALMAFGVLSTGISSLFHK